MRITRPVITGRKGLITTGHYLATQVGAKIMSAGGNAVDAGVAAGFALAVLKPEQNSLGGECPIIIYSPKTKLVKVISGQGPAPRKASLQWFKDNGIKFIPQDGFLGATVPGLFGSYCTALMEFGRLRLKEVLLPAIEIAEEGFPIHNALSNTIQRSETRFRDEWPFSAEIFLHKGHAPESGFILKQKALANTFKRLVSAEDNSIFEGREVAIKKAIDYFYKGDIAMEILEFSKNNPIRDATGDCHTTLLEIEDFRNYITKIEDPVHVDFKKYRIFKCGPWSQGPVFLQQLKLLEGFNLKKMGHNSSRYIHILTECAKLAFADREDFYGDPEFSMIPIDMLLSSDYNNKRRALVDLLHANNKNMWGKPPLINTKYQHEGDTTHLDVIDSEGYMMSATQSGGWIPTSPIIPNLGFPLGTRAQIFNFVEGHPNCIEPGKRPRTTLTPSLAFKEGRPWMVFGTPGGDMQDQWSLQFFLNIVEFDMDMQRAIDSPTVHTRHFPDSFYPHTVTEKILYAEKGIDKRTLSELEIMGHVVDNEQPHDFGSVAGIRIDYERKLIEGVASSKGDGQAYAFGE